VNSAGGVFENDVGQGGGVGFIWLMGAEADAGVEGSVYVEVDGRAEWVHWFAFQADVEGKGVAAFFKADSFCHHVDQAVGTGSARTASAADAILHVFYADVLLGALGQLDHAQAMQCHDDLLGVIVEILADDEDRFAISITVGVGEGDVGGQGSIAGELLPEEAKFVAGVPDVVAGGVDGVLAVAGSKLALPGIAGLPMSD